MKVLHISTHNENCGIGKYQELYLKAFAVTDPTSQHQFFPHSPNKIRKMNEEDTNKVLAELADTVHHYDVVHIQHELSFYHADFLSKVVSIVKAAGVPLVSTIHTKVLLSEDVIGLRISPFYWRRKIGSRLSDKKVIERFMPLAQSDLVLVHNAFTKKSLEDIGFKSSKITVLPIPVPTIDKAIMKKTSPDAEELLDPIKREEGDILLATVGYLNGIKGTLHAVKAMRGLPENYKLAIIGGLHPRAKDDKLLDEVADYIYDYGLSDRVYVTGSPTDDIFNAAINKADIILYPYLRSYASSSAALNNAFALGKPIIAFPAAAFVEINEKQECMAICESFSYYDLIKKIKQQNTESLARLSKLSTAYAALNSYELISADITNLYRSLVTNK